MCVCVCVCVCVSLITMMLWLTTNCVYVAFSDQEERQWAIREYKEGRKDVLVATDVASKGLDFTNIQHVINFDMPADIENYGWLLL